MITEQALQLQNHSKFCSIYSINCWESGWFYLPVSQFSRWLLDLSYARNFLLLYSLISRNGSYESSDLIVLQKFSLRLIGRAAFQRVFRLLSILLDAITGSPIDRPSHINMFLKLFKTSEPTKFKRLLFNVHVASQ